MGWSWEHFFRFLFSEYMLNGVWTTIWLATVAMFLGVSLGVIVAFMKVGMGQIFSSHWSCPFPQTIFGIYFFDPSIGAYNIARFHSRVPGE